MTAEKDFGVFHYRASHISARAGHGRSGSARTRGIRTTVVRACIYMCGVHCFVVRTVGLLLLLRRLCAALLGMTMVCNPLLHTGQWDCDTLATEQMKLYELEIDERMQDIRNKKEAEEEYLRVTREITRQRQEAKVSLWWRAEPRKGVPRRRRDSGSAEWL